MDVMTTQPEDRLGLYPLLHPLGGLRSWGQDHHIVVLGSELLSSEGFRTGHV